MHLQPLPTHYKIVAQSHSRFQHEMDHLNGKIFVERILEQDGKLFKITGKDKKGKEPKRLKEK